MRALAILLTAVVVFPAPLAAQLRVLAVPTEAVPVTPIALTSPGLSAGSPVTLSAVGGVTQGLPALSALRPTVSVATLNAAASARPVVASRPAAAARPAAARSLPARRASDPARLRNDGDERALSARALLDAGGRLAVGDLPDGAWNPYWDRGRRAEDAPAVPAEPDFKPRPNPLVRGLTVLTPASGVAVALPTLAKVSSLLPYAYGAGALAGTWLLNKIAQRIIAAVSKSRQWRAHTTLLIQRATSAGLWTVGSLVSLNLAGVEWWATATSLGVGTLAISLAVREFLGNFVQGVIFLLNHPFDVGEKVKIGKKTYTILDMTLRQVVLRPEKSEDPEVLKKEAEEAAKAKTPPYEGARHVWMTYTQLADKPITLFHEPEQAKQWIRLHRPSLAGAKAAFAVAKPKSWWKPAGALGALGAAAYPAYRLHGWLASAAPYLYAAGLMAATVAAAGLVRRVIDGLAAKRQWDPSAAAVIRIFAMGVTYVAGLLFSLSTAGVAGSTLLASLGITTAVISIAVTTVVQNALRGADNIGSGHFTLGDRIKIGDHEGIVVDMTFRYIVLKGFEEKPSYTLLPYGYVAANEIEVLKDYEKAGGS